MSGMPSAALAHQIQLLLGKGAAKLWIDIETRSRVPITRGTSKYATEAEVMVMSWAVNDGPITVEDLTAGTISPAFVMVVKMILSMKGEVWAHNAEFDRTLLDTCAPWWRDLGVPLESWRCTAALARLHGLPGGLDKLSIIFKLGDSSKDTKGKQLIHLFCEPNKDGVYNDRHSHPAQWAEFLTYAGQDVVAMRECWRKTPHWNATPRMWSVYHLDQRINQRGVAMDLLLAKGAVEGTTAAKKRLSDKTVELTEGDVESTTQRNRLLAYMAAFGVSLPDLTADTVERRLEDESLPEHIKELLRVRQQASKASTAKYKRVLDQHVAGRLRNLLVFCGAARTGRWAGRTLQPQNLPRPKHTQEEIEAAIRAFRSGTIELYGADNVLPLASSCLRGLIVADPGRRLVVADLANIEGRFMAWVAGEQWKLEAYAAYDRKEGPDLYKIAYARAFDIDPDSVTKDQRQIGKVMELALQYYGGVGAFCSMADTYGLRLEHLADSAWPVIPGAVKARAAEAYKKAKKRKRVYGLEERVWLVCHALVLMWRDAHPAIVKFWDTLDKATKAATRRPDYIFQVGKFVKVDRRGNWLRIKLPSGRYLCYPSPQGDEYTSSFLGVDPYTKQWVRISTYSGKRAENIVQAGSADIIMDGLLAAEAHGYNPVLSVHDEVISEPPDDSAFDDKGLSHLLVSSSKWAVGMPLAAEGSTSKRYHK